jgi:hypothetical protein
MIESPMTDAHKCALIIAYYLSKFDRKGLRYLGFKTFTEAFQKVGEILKVPPATVKNMRDQFDPYCSHVRVGWYQREILRSRLNVLIAYDELSEIALASIVQDLLSKDAEKVEAYIAPVGKIEEQAEAVLSDDNPIATRLRTGEIAETFFIQRYSKIEVFSGSVFEDTRKLGIGFDFRASFPNMYYAIEVKGVREEHGNITFTDREWSVARYLGEQYFLALVRSLDSKPSLDLILNPAAQIQTTMRASEAIAVSWNARV